ncbi:bifunctional 3-(3-hydroxy-phenyl)propionate/3-hydroxycinnamic acid hydroxylase MhpA [Nocardia aurantia]|uniref:3-(3-hydroxy-phenyl)propionate/3-hydroxycinnamic acid hydroxylase n=1 Tax=Nocardia aurantia TaxID=2585199 RepID=A0A7K0DUQ6_9NOCA|nr:bifunctional 3-(3-hydroxy-phenyl)propionate/3-hydroxycinnamic acid hydroxylase [Nocardia aurantia]MQY29257.1 3-(3-hydroxy-phenyl)propionate/3-hydroxycinnamic acid hydroxylase [Nocardia aurantia]
MTVPSGEDDASAASPERDTGATELAAHRPVVILGAGPTGLTAAALLADRGVECLVLDRWDGVYPQPRAVHLDDEVHRILGMLGVAAEFAEISRPGRGLRLLDARHRVLAEFSRATTSGRHGFPAASMFDQPDLERLLRRAVARRSRITLRSGVEVERVAHERDRVAVSMVDRHTGDREVVRARFVLGADGANSIVRRCIGSRWEEMGFTQRWLVVDIGTPLDLEQWEGVQQVCDSHRAATFMRIGAARYRWEFQLRAGESVTDFDTPDRLDPLIRPWLGDTPTAELDLIRAAEYTFRACVADRWRDRRILLLGDAAHLTPPFIGQGLGSGMRDAANLAWKLAGVLHGDLPEDSLDSYQTERKPHAAALIRLAVGMGGTMTRGGVTGDRLRRLAVPLLARLPGFAAMVTDSATPPLSPSMFVRPGSAAALPGRSSRPAGTLCPNVPIEPGGERLDRLGPRFLVLTLDSPSAAQGFEITRRGAVVVHVPTDSESGDWLREHNIRAALIRPDRTVMAAGMSVAAVYTHLPSLPDRLAATPAHPS